MAETKKTSSRRLGRTPEGHSRVSMNRLKILVTTVNRAKADFYMDHIQSFGVNMQMVFFGKGTAPQEILAAMGLTDSDRAVIFSLIGEDKNGDITEIACDTVALSLGVRPRKDALEALEGVCEEMYAVGDCALRQGNITTAVRDGFYAAMNV